MVQARDAATSGAFWSANVVDAGTEACEQDLLAKSMARGRLIGNVSEWELDRQITRLAAKRLGGEAGSVELPSELARRHRGH